ncbi:MAG: exonuclease domain-containing protein, partial [Myxococcota bacterium]|nr:exonuclease domain-containing protein [Myxococcota bacterium]
MPWNRPIHEVSFVAFDLEATGLTPMVDTVTEVGAVRFRITRDGTVKQGPVMESLVCPGREIPSRVSELTGIDDAMVRDAPTLEELWPRWN